MLDFPGNPNLGDTWTGSNGVDYIWDGVKWVATGVAGSGGPFLPTAGGTMLGPLNWTSSGTITSRSAQDRSAEIFDVLDFGVIGDGVTDDTQAVQAALTAAGNAGGGIVWIGRNICLCGNLTVPQNVTLRGDWEVPALPLTTTGNEQFTGLYTQPSQIILQPNTAIILASCTAVAGLIISRAGLTAFPASSAAELDTLLSQFGGYCLSTNGTDVVFRDLLLIGHLFGIQTGSVSPSGRLVFEHVRGDCLNGIIVNFCYDIGRVLNCHFYPWVSYNVPGVRPDQLARNGTAYQITNSDWIQFVNCFAFGWTRNFNIVDTTTATFVACHSDGAGTNNDFGWAFSGVSDPVLMTACSGNSATTMVQVNPTQPANPTLVPTSVRTTDCRFAAITTCVHVMQGSYTSANDTFESGNTAAIVAASGTSGRVVGSQFRWVTEAVSFADAATQANWDIIACSYTGTTPMPLAPNRLTELLTVPGLIADPDGIVSNGPVSLQATAGDAPSLRFITVGNPVDANIWDAFASGTNFAFRLVNDAYTNGNPWVQVSRNGFVPLTVTLAASEIVFAGRAMPQEGLSFGSVTATTPSDASHHLSLFDGYASINVTAGALNIFTNGEVDLYSFGVVSARAIGGNFQIIGEVGFNNTTPIARPAITGSRAGNAALASLLTELAAYGLVTDNTTA